MLPTSIVTLKGNVNVVRVVDDHPEERLVRVGRRPTDAGRPAQPGGRASWCWSLPPRAGRLHGHRHRLARAGRPGRR